MRWFLLVLLVACGTEGSEDSDVGSCDVPCQTSTASSGGSCQVNLYCTTDEPAAYCFEEDDGTYSCDCGPAVDNPPSFTSTDICDLEREAAACAAMAACSNWTYN
ncbi:MAG: hypothetical protein KC912_20035 [Proteobacteria bacterium]|nr:hypothetical protein [Pseudomonadota bacterium]